MNNPISDLRTTYWLYRFLPQKAITYAQLARLDRPIGRKLLFWPCVWSLLLAFYSQKSSLNMAILPLPQAEFPPTALAHYHQFSTLGFFLFTIVLFFIGAALMRGAGCTYNDIVDYKIDAKVARTATRPLPAKQISLTQAWAFIGLQCLGGLIILLQLNYFAILLSCCSLFIVALYPFVKRFSDWPQAVLGLAFNWGVLTGFVTVSNTLTLPAFMLYSGAVFWTIGYDTIYAHQDREHDTLIGVHSTARLFGGATRMALIIFYGLTFVLFFTAFFLINGGFYPLLGVVSAGLVLLYQVIRFDMHNPALCLHLFKSNAVAGWLLAVPAFIGLLNHA